jgi:hypothetical protein
MVVGIVADFCSRYSVLVLKVLLGYRGFNVYRQDGAEGKI